MINDLWYKNAIVYCLSVEHFMDTNGDGIGDFQGLMRRLDYLHGLGITTLWLMPFQPSPQRDDGYDIADYYGVDPRYGTLGDFVEGDNEGVAYVVFGTAGGTGKGAPFAVPPRPRWALACGLSAVSKLNRS